MQLLEVYRMFKQICESLLNNNVRDIKDIYYLNIYHPYYIGAKKHKNPNFDKFSSLILDVKKKEQSAINHFYKHLDSFVRKDCPIAIVPSSNPENINTGICQIAILLSQHSRINATSCLQRHRKVEKKSRGGNRSIDVDLSTINVNNKEIIKGKNVLLLDDVTTSGNSLYACEQLLLQAGAAKVLKLALGKTALNIPICIKTSSSKPDCEKIIKHWDWKIDGTVCFHNMDKCKPYPKPIQKGLIYDGIKVYKALAIGNTAKYTQAESGS